MKRLIKILLREGLDEARSIEGNISKEENLGELLKHIYDKYGFKNTYVSFRDTEHVGKINPNNRFNTPTGLYTYNLSNFIDKPMNNLRTFRSLFPFASERKYIQFLVIDDSINILDSNSDKSKIDTYVKEIQNKFVEETGKGAYLSAKQYFKSGRLFINIELEKLIDNWFDDGYQSYYASAKHPTHKFWLFLYDIIPYIYPDGKKNNSFAIICRALGIDGFHDDKCEGWIHPSEKCQTVFFKSNVFQDEFILSSVQTKMKEPTKDGTKLRKVPYTDNQIIKMISQHKINLIKDFDKLTPYLGNSKIKNYIVAEISNEDDIRDLLEYSNEPEKVLNFLGDKGVEVITKLKVAQLIYLVMYANKPERLSFSILSNSKITDRLENKKIAGIISQSKSDNPEKFVDILGNRLNEILVELSHKDFIRIFNKGTKKPDGSDNLKNQKLADRLINDKNLMSQLDAGKAPLLIHFSNHGSGDMESDLIKYGHKS